MGRGARTHVHPFATPLTKTKGLEMKTQVLRTQRLITGPWYSAGGKATCNHRSDGTGTSLFMTKLPPGTHWTETTISSGPNVHTECGTTFAMSQLITHINNPSKTIREKHGTYDLFNRMKKYSNNLLVHRTNYSVIKQVSDTVTILHAMLTHATQGAVTNKINLLK